MTENIVLQNNSIDADEYIWDFCSEDIIQTPENNSRNISGLNLGLGIDVQRQDSIWVGFLTSYNNRKLFRLVYSDLEQEPEIEDLGDLGGMIDQPEEIELIYSNNEWHAFIASLEPGHGTLRLDFGNSLLNPPSVTNLGDFGFTTSKFRDLKIVTQNEDIILVLADRENNKLIRINFGNSVYNVVGAGDIYETLTLPGVSFLHGVDIVNDCGEWKSVVTSYLNANILLLSFGSDVLSEPTIIATYLFTSVIRPYRIRLVEERNNFYAFVSNESVNTSLINFYRLDDIVSPIELDNSAMVTSLSNHVLVENGKKYFFGVGFGNTQSTSVFENTCGESHGYSSESIPVGVSYSNSGSYSIELVSRNSTSGYVSFSSSSIVVNASVAPSLDFATSGFCLSNPISFTSTSDQSLTSYNWDFGDGSGTSSDPNPSYTYASTGTYNVRLTVESGENGCGQFIEQEITVYNEPISDITVPAGTLCSNTPINFTNSSIFDIGSPVTWEWDFGDSNTSTEFEPEHTYLVGGNYTVTLTATLPEGCVSVATQNIFVEQGALPNFFFNNSCQGEIIQFNDLSSSPSPITNWDWDFGDGSSASIQNPAYSYTSVGTFDVTLSVTNQLGCVTSITQQVNNFANPIVDFDNDLSCSGSLTSFTDQSIVQDANISTWFWDFGTGNVEDRDTLQNPQFEYQEPGEYDVTLTVRSNFGCETTLVKPVTVNPGPIASFDWDESCLGSETQFINNTTTDPSNPLVSTVWTIEGNIIESTAPAYNFDEVGSYPVVLSVVAENFCESTQIDTVHVTNNPIANFNSQQFCDSDTILFYDTTIIPPGDSVNVRLWDFGIFGTSTDSVAKVYWPDTESRVVKFQIGTDNGCLSSINQSVSREIQPVASFEPSVNFGAAPLTVSFANFSENASGYSWEFGNGEVSDDENPVVQYLEEGIYTVLLNATTASGCADTVSQTVEVVAPEMEMELVSLLSRAVGDQVEVILNMANNGSIVVDESNLEIVSKIGTGFELTQDFDDVIASNTSQNYSLNFRLNDNGLNRNQSICVELRTTDPDNPDIVPENNEQCIFVKPEPIFSDPFPNPAQDELVVEVVLPEPDDITINLVNSQGQTVYNQIVSETQAGINSISLDLQTFRAGNYVLLVFYQGWERSYNVVLVK